MKKAPVIMIGLDAADWHLVRQLCDQGDMPNLQRMIETGAWGELASPAGEYAGGVWPDFYTGQSVEQHGIYHNKLWRSEHMRVEVPTDEWLGQRPFYEELSGRGLTVCAIDVPMVLGKPRPVNGQYLGGWGTHDLISKGSWPASFWKQLESEFGKPLMPVEHYGNQSAEGLLALRETLMRATRQMSGIACKTLQSTVPDFACIVFGATHRAGHYLWDASQLEDRIGVSMTSDLEDSLRQIYREADRVLGEVLEVLPADAHRVAFAVHGMESNHGWSDLGADLIDALLASATRRPPKKGWLYQLRRRLPFHWVRPVLTRLPTSVSELLVRLWSARMYDWHSTPYFPLPMDQAGYLRINLRGRESQGIVSEADYDALCEQLTRWFLGIYDPDTDKPLVKRVSRPWAEAPPEAAARDVLPDLLIEWGDLKLGETRRLLHREFRNMLFQVPEKAISGRSGNHVGRGWVVYQGPSNAVGELTGYHIRDLAPTMFHLLGQSIPETFEGRIIPLTRHDGEDSGNAG